MTYNYAWIASMVSVYLGLLTAPLVLGSWVVLQRTRLLLAGLWLLLLFCLLVAALVVGAIGLYVLASTPNGSVRPG